MFYRICEIIMISNNVLSNFIKNIETFGSYYGWSEENYSPPTYNDSYSFHSLRI